MAKLSTKCQISHNILPEFATELLGGITLAKEVPFGYIFLRSKVCFMSSVCVSLLK